MTDILRALYEAEPCLVTALMAGYLVIWWDGQVYLTDRGEEYLEMASVGRDEGRCAVRFRALSQFRTVRWFHLEKTPFYQVADLWGGGCV
jgi:hypothetical protein